MLKRLTIYLGLLAGLAFVIYSCAKEDDTVLISTETEILETQQSQIIDGQYMVIFNEGAVDLGRADINAANYWEMRDQVADQALDILRENRIAERELIQVYAKVFQGIALQLTQEEVRNLEADARVDFIEQDQTVHVTMGGPPGGGGGGGVQSTPWGITRVGGPDGGGSYGTAWIIDSGIDLDHPDLNVDVNRSVSFLSGGGASSANDDNGHGTHVAGTVAAIDNTEGVIGVAPGAAVVAVRVLDRRGSGAYSGVTAGVDYVAANAGNSDAANMSLGGPGSSALDAAVSAASSSCPFALAAGNESQHAGNVSPARVNGNNIYTVSSMTQSGNWSSFSNYGNPPVDYCAPGSSVLSTYKGGGYATLSGTSMASPHVCGILLARNGTVGSNGTVNGDPDGDPDPIAHL